jgi:glucan 1,3-beta-glucosidase
MSLLEPTTLGNLLDGLGIAPDLLKPIPGLLGSVMDTVHGITETIGGVTAGLGLPLPSLSLPGLGKVLAVTPMSFVDASSGYLDNQSRALYSRDALVGSVSKNSTSPNDSQGPDSPEDSNLVDNAFSSASSTCTVEPYQPETVTATLPAPNITLSTIYRYRRQQSVNLGSLFVLESWMVPSLFACAAQPAVSELDVANGWGGSARALLERHWDTWITEKDFQWMASIGINTVRLPLGYWHLPTEHAVGTAYEGVGHIYQGAWPRVIRTVSMAADHGIGVLIDLHGAPGSQNGTPISVCGHHRRTYSPRGQPHSGVSDGQAALFSVPSNMDKAVDVLAFLTKTFVNVPNIVGIQLLNEPNNVPELLSFYNRALDSLRSVAPEAGRFPFYVHDGFDMRRGTDFVESRSDWVVLDHHACTLLYF